MASTVFPIASSGGAAVVQKVQAFTSTGTFTAPSNCYSLTLFLVGGGGGGGGGRISSNDRSINGGGGGGGSVIKKTVSITPSTVYTFTIGAGGAGGSLSASGSVGSDSTMTGSGFTTITALGGGGGNSRNGQTSTNYIGTARATTGGQIGEGNQTSGGGGGAGGNAISYQGGTGAFLTGVASYYSKPVAPNGGNTGIQSSGGTGGQYMPIGLAVNVTSLAGIGIDNYGNGGPGAANTLTYDTTTYAQVSSFAGIDARRTSGCDSVAGVASIANTGNGGGGCSVCNQSDCGAQENTGGAGGSGFALITYWT
jgi:hypothetical protein